METKRESTRSALAKSLKKLMMKYPFDKITIKMITDEAGFIRPTFYNYFYDKHEVLEYIFTSEIVQHVNEYMDKGDFYKGLEVLFVNMENDRDFYIKAFKVTGQNSFYDMVYKHFYENFKNLYDAVKDSAAESIGNKPFDRDVICRYYANGLVFMTKIYLEDKSFYSAKEWTEKYTTIIDEAILDVMSGKFRKESGSEE